jgi:hypothetical protein
MANVKQTKPLTRGARVFVAKFLALRASLGIRADVPPALVAGNSIALRARERCKTQG